MASAKTLPRIRATAADRREQILTEATRLIGQRGYNGFIIQELAQRCRLTNAGILHHFGSKENLLIALLQYRDQRSASAVTTEVGLALRDRRAVKLTLDEALALFHAIVASNVMQPELLRLYSVLSAEALDQTHPAHEYFVKREADALGAFAKIVAPHVKHPRSMARQMLALMAGLEQQWLRANQQFDLVAAWDDAATLLLQPNSSSR